LSQVIGSLSEADRRCAHRLHLPSICPARLHPSGPDEQGDLPVTYPGKLDLDWDGETDSLDRDWLESLLAPVTEFQSTHGKPVAVNEYGVMRFEPGAAEYLNDLMELFEGLGINHALWAWTSARVLRYGDVQEFEYRLGPDTANLTEEVPSELLEVIASN
jgi:hypothetical protein